MGFWGEILREIIRIYLGQGFRGGKFYLVRLCSTGEEVLEDIVLAMEGGGHSGAGAASELRNWRILHLSSSLQEEPGHTEVTSSCSHAES